MNAVEDVFLKEGKVRDQVCVYFMPFGALAGRPASHRNSGKGQAWPLNLQRQPSGESSQLSCCILEVVL